MLTGLSGHVSDCFETSPSNRVPFTFDIDGVPHDVLEYNNGRKLIASTDNELDGIIKKLRLTQQRAGFEVNVTGAGEAKKKKRLICSCNPKRDSKVRSPHDPTRKRHTMTKRFTKCPVVLNFWWGKARGGDTGWLVTHKPFTVHNHDPYVIRESIALLDIDRQALTVDRTEHSAPISYMLSRLRSENIPLTSQEVRNIITTQQRHTRQQQGTEQLSDTGMLINNLTNASGVAFVALISENQKETDRPLSSKTLLKVPSVCVQCFPERHHVIPLEQVSAVNTICSSIQTYFVHLHSQTIVGATWYHAVTSCYM